MLGEKVKIKPMKFGGIWVLFLLELLNYCWIVLRNHIFYNIVNLYIPSDIPIEAYPVSLVWWYWEWAAKTFIVYSCISQHFSDWESDLSFTAEYSMEIICYRRAVRVSWFLKFCWLWFRRVIALIIFYDAMIAIIEMGYNRWKA